MTTPLFISDQVLAVNNDLPIKTDQPIHNGKVRSVYWLTQQDSKRLIEEKNYAVPSDSPLAIMVISDRISAFECLWKGEGGLEGIIGKGAALNAISNHWFQLFKEQGLADSHIVDIPHPFVWIVRKAKPIMIEAIARQYITGSMWRAYAKGERNFCGIELPDNLQKDQKLSGILVTPSTKGVIKGIPNVPEIDDVNISKNDISTYFKHFAFLNKKDIEHYEYLLTQGFTTISQALEKIGQIFVDTKFEFGYVKNQQGEDQLIYMDEIGTPDSSRIWDQENYQKGNIIEQSKEQFRQALLQHFPEPDILLNKNRMDERFALAENNLLPEEIFYNTSQTYLQIAEKITGKAIVTSKNPREEIINVLNQVYGLIK